MLLVWVLETPVMVVVGWSVVSREVLPIYSCVIDVWNKNFTNFLSIS